MEYEYICYQKDQFDWIYLMVHVFILALIMFIYDLNRICRNDGQDEEQDEDEQEAYSLLEETKLVIL